MQKLFINAITKYKNKIQKINFLVNEQGIIKNIIDEQQLKNFNHNEFNIIDLKNNFIIPSFTLMNSDFLNFISYCLICDVSDSKNIIDVINKINKYLCNFEYKNGNIIVYGLKDELINKMNKDILDQCKTECNLFLFINQINDFILNTNAINFINSLNKSININNDGYIDKKDISYFKTLVPPKTNIELQRIFNIIQNKIIQSGIISLSLNINNIDDLYFLLDINTSNLLKLDLYLFFDYNLIQQDNDIKKIFKINENNNIKFTGINLVIDNEILINEKQYKNNEWLLLMKTNIQKAINYSINKKIKLYITANNIKSIELLINTIDEMMIDKNILKQYLIIQNNNIDLYQIRNISEFNNFIVDSSNLIWTSYNHLAYKNNDLNKTFVLNKSLIKANQKLITQHLFIANGLNIFESIWSLTNRKNNLYKIVNEEEIVNLDIALDSITNNPNLLLNNNSKNLEINKEANFIVLNQNPYIIDKTYLYDIKIEQTYKLGINLFKKQLQN